ncbi:MAG: hypothetical protein L6E13_05655 [Firmicutes bacterium]|nr:hypothetical protein [Bacillota bacterium]
MTGGAGEVLRTAWSVAWYGWRAVYNRTFRFSRSRPGLVFQLSQLGLLLVVAQQARSVPPEAGREGLLALMAVQMAWFGLMIGFGRGQFQLFQGILVPLFQITPARPLAFLVGRALEYLPSRVWSAFLWSLAYSAAVPGPGRWGAFLTLAAAGAATGVLASLAGLLLVVLWARYSPRTLRRGSLFFGLTTVALATWAAIFLATGGTVADLALRLRSLRTLVAGAVAALAGLPGLGMLAAAALRPRWVEDLYRTGLTRVLELGEQEASRPGRSVWPSWPQGPVRAVVAREWIQWSRSRMTRIQGVIWLCGAIGVYTAGRSLAGTPLPQVVQTVGSLSLLAWGLAYSHWVVRVFEAERAGILLYRLAGVPAATLLGAKFLAVFLPSAVLTGLPALMGGLAAGLSGPDLGRLLGWTLLALAAGCLGGFGAAGATAGEEPPEPAQAPVADQMAPPQGGNVNGWYVLFRMAGLLLPIALVIWTGSRPPGSPPGLPPALLVSLNLLLPFALLAGGYQLMRRHWDAGGAG